MPGKGLEMKNLITCLVVCVLSGGAAFATTWTVDDDGKADFDNIQAAVDAASDGDEIIVMPGTYTGDGLITVNTLGKEITLISKDGADNTIISGEGLRRGIVCNSQESTKTFIIGFTVTNCFWSGVGAGFVLETGSPTFINCVSKNNEATGSGGGAYCYESNARFMNCMFQNNVSGDEGGGLFSETIVAHHLSIVRFR